MVKLYLVLLLAVLTVLAQLTDAAWRVNLEQVNLEHHISKRSVHFHRNNPSDLLGLKAGEHLVPGNKFRTAKGTTKLKMQETYKGLLVVGESVVLEMDDEGRLTGEVSGRLLKGISEDIPTPEPGISVEEALEKALVYAGDSREHITFDAYKDAVLEIDVRGEEHVIPCLVYQLNYQIEQRGQLSRPSFIIDANTGHVLKNWNAMTTANWRHRSKRRANPITTYELVDGVGGNAKVGKHLYGLDLSSLKVSVASDGSCVLENQYAIVYNCNQSKNCSIDGMEPHHFECAKGNNDTINEAYSPLNDAFFYVGITYEMYAEWYEISDILKNKDVNGGRCPTRVHYGQDYENAFWNGRVITFGDGESMFYPLTSLNVVAHEISHGFTEKNSNLVYDGQSGGINEAFSDMAGEAAEYFLNQKMDWMVGFGVIKKKNESLRYFEEPTRDGRSIDHFDDFCHDMNVHLSSGIYNKAFYILSNRPGWCVRTAFHIFVIANDMYWKPESNFHDAACDVQRAAGDLGYNVDDVTYAFREVGVEPCSKNYSYDLASAYMLKNTSPMSFRLSNANDEDLHYTELILLVEGWYPMTLMVQTKNFIYTVKPTADIIDKGQNAAHINLGRECYKENCTITLSTERETPVKVVPIAQIQDLVAGVNLEADDSNYTTSFEIPKVILENKLRVMFTGSMQTHAKGITYYIRHGEPPIPASYQYDVKGSLGGVSKSLCKPREGTYYLVIQSSSVPLVSINIKLGVRLNGDKIEEGDDTDFYSSGTVFPSGFTTHWLLFLGTTMTIIVKVGP